MAQIQKSDIITGESFRFNSEVLNEEREVFVSLPTHYESSTHAYPVLIVLDGEYLFDIARSIVNIKASRNEMPESIIVGIPNNTGKRSDMSLQLTNKDGRKFFGDHGGKARDYLSFFRKELLPFLEKNYRINNHRSIIGMSPSFGPVLEAFWHEPDLFSGYIVLAAELSLTTDSGETVADKLLKAIQDKERPKAAIYVGKAGKDLKRRPPEERASFVKINGDIEATASPKIQYTIEILENEDHYGMSITGIQHGLETIYPPDIWDIPYRDFWNAENPAQALKSFYDRLSTYHGFEILPLEDSFYASQTLSGTIRRLTRQGRTKALADFLKLAIEYYPNSKQFKD